MYYINIYLSLLQVLSDVRTAVHQYEHVSASKCRYEHSVDMNTCQPVSVEQTHYYKFHYPNSLTISVENTRKHISFVTFNIDFFPWLFPLFCKISVKRQAAKLKVKTAKKLRKFSSIEILTFKYKL